MDLRVGVQSIFRLLAPVLLLVASSARAEAPTSEQARCLNDLNKLGWTLSLKQEKAALSCVGAAAAGKTSQLGLPGQTQTAQACLTNDVKATVAKAAQKLADADARRCLAAPGQMPPFGYVGAAVLRASAKGEAIGIVADLFGQDLDAALVEVGADRKGAACQALVLKQTGKLYDAVWKTILARKKDVLRCSQPNPPGTCLVKAVPVAQSREEFEAALLSGIASDAKGLIARAASALASGAASQCGSSAASLPALFPGACSESTSVAELAQCAEQVARARSCRALNGFDGLAAACPPLPGRFPDIEVQPTLDFGAVSEGVTTEQALSIENRGDADLVIASLSGVSAPFALVLEEGVTLPLTVPPGTSRPVTLRVTPVAGSATTTVSGELTITSDDPDEPVRAVFLSVDVQPATPPPAANPIAGAVLRADGIEGQISATSCDSVEVHLQLTDDAIATDSLAVAIVDAVGGSTASVVVPATTGAGTLVATGIDACALADGIVVPSIIVTRATGALAPVLGSEGAKNTSPLPPPVVDPLAQATFSSAIEVCGSKRANTTVTITGGAFTAVSQPTSSAGTTFCVTVPLRPRQENLLRVSVVDDLAVDPRPRAYAVPVSVHQLDIADIVAVETSARPLTAEETIALVEADLIDLDDPDNFNISQFTISITIGDRVFTTTQVVATPIDPAPGAGSVSFGVPPLPSGGAGGGGGGTAGETAQARSGWSGSTERPTVILPPPPSEGGCTTACMQLVTITTPTGQTVPGVILIDGRIKTLKELFQVSIAISNTATTPALNLEQVSARVVLPGGLTAIRAGVGTDLGTLNLDGEVDAATIGTIAPGETGRAQFLVRGDQIGSHTIDVAFEGFVTGAALAEPFFPFSGASATTVDVFGAPELAVVLRHPTNPGGPDVTLNEIYPLVLEITNISNRPALFTTVDMFVGGGVRLVDEDDVPLPESLASRAVGHVFPGQTVTLAYRVQSLIQGDIIACQAIASDNISLSIDTGPDGADCAVGGMVRSGGVPLPPDLPPIVLGVTPVNGAVNAGLSSDVLAVLTPRAACLVEDGFADIVTEAVNPGIPGSALKVVRANLVAPGTFRLEELDAFGRPVAAVPVDLTLENPPSGGTTLASLRLGLASPLSQASLKPDTRYRATLVGGPGGVCSASSSLEMASSFRWVFSTGDTCDAGSPTATLLVPADGSSERPIDQAIEVEFSGAIDPATLRTEPGDVGASSFAVVQGGVASGGDVVGGTMVAGSATLDPTGRRLRFVASAPLPTETLIHVRLTNALETPCGSALVTPVNGVKLFSFTTAAPDTTPPAPPAVNTLPVATNLVFLQVSGTAEAGAQVTVSGGASPASGTAGVTGLFSVSVPLLTDATNTLSATARDASGNVSAATTTAAGGAPLQVLQDSTPPSVVSVVPANGAQGIPASATVTVTFDEPILPASVTGANFQLLNGTNAIAGSFAVSGSSYTFTPDAPLPASTNLTVRLRAGGVRDTLGNALASDVLSTFTTSGGPPVVTGINPLSGLQGTIINAQILGSNLAGVTSVTIDGTGVSVTDLGTGSATARNVRFAIDATAALGARNVTVTTPSGSASGTFSVVDSPTEASIVWIAPTGGDWNVASNWNENRVPNANDDVRIATAGPVTFSGTSTVRSLALFSPLHVSGSLTIGNGAVSPAAVVHVAGDLRANASGQVTVRGGLTLNGTATVASLNTGFLTRLEFGGSQVVDGTGDIVFDSTSSAGANVARPTESGTVTIGAGITVRGSNGTLGGPDGTLVFLGTVSPDVSGRTIALGGEIDNGGQEMNVVSGPGAFTFVGGAIRNAIVSGDGRIESSQSDPNGGELEAVVLNAGLRVNATGQVTVRGGLTLNGTATVASLNTGFLTRLEFGGSQVVDGTGDIVFDSTSAVAQNVARPTEGGTVTIGAGITVRGGNGTLGGPNGTLVFLGTVSPDVAGRTIALGGEIDNGGQEMNVVSGPGAFTFVGGAIRNAIVSGDGRIESSQSDPNGGELEAVVLNAGLRVNATGQVTVRGGLTLNGTATVASLNTGFLTRLEFGGSQVVDGTGDIVFDSTSAVAQNVARPTEGGTVTIGAGITVRGGNGTLGGPNGTVNLLGTVDADVNGRTIALAGAFQNHGSIGARAGGTLRLDTPTSAGGTMRAGAGGNVTATSGLILGASDTLAVEIAGTSTSQFGRVTVPGAATIAGGLAIKVDGGFSPALGQRFRFMTFGSRSGVFGSISGDDLGGGLSLDLDTSDPTDLELVVVTP